MFSLFLDRVEAFLVREAGDGIALEYEAIHLAGAFIPLLLFADDIVIPSRLFGVL